MRKSAPCATTQYRHWFAALVAVTIISRSRAPSARRGTRRTRATRRDDAPARGIRSARSRPSPAPRAPWRGCPRAGRGFPRRGSVRSWRRLREMHASLRCGHHKLARAPGGGEGDSCIAAIVNARACCYHGAVPAILRKDKFKETRVNKIYPSADAALKGVVKDGQLIAVGGFGLCGIPEALIMALHDSKVHNLTCISNNAGVDGIGLGKLLETRQIKKMIARRVARCHGIEPVPAGPARALAAPFQACEPDAPQLLPEAGQSQPVVWDACRNEFAGRGTGC